MSSVKNSTRGARTSWNRLRDGGLACCWRFPMAARMVSRSATVLLYHGIPANRGGNGIDAATFDTQIALLASHFELISLDKIDHRSRLGDRPLLALTFDDGMRNNAEFAAPILRKHRAPAGFFVCSRHTDPQKPLWAAYFRALQRFYPWKTLPFRNSDLDMTPSTRHETVHRLRTGLLHEKPHPAAVCRAIDNELPPLSDFVPEHDIQENYAGMTAEQLGELAADRLFTVGVHTVDHPYLTLCEPNVITSQLSHNKQWLEQATGKSCRHVAYPCGDYDATILKKCHDLGLTEGYAVAPSVGTRASMERPRVGVYTGSLEVLGFKATWGKLIRKLKVNVG